MVLLKTIVILMTAWIGTAWPYSWTSLLLTISFAVLCLSLAYEQYNEERAMRSGGPETA